MKRNAVGSVIGCVLISDEGDIRSSFSNCVWPRSPHLSETGLGWLCVCFPHSEIALLTEEPSSVLGFCVLTRCSLPLWLSLSVSPFPRLKVGTVNLQSFTNPNATIPIAAWKVSPKFLKPAFLQCWRDVNSFRSVLLGHCSPFFWLHLSA